MGDAIAKIRWRCRRGMRELDAILDAFLQREGGSLTAEDIAVFERVLDLQDPELYGYVVGRSEPADPHIAAFIARVRAARSRA